MIKKIIVFAIAVTSFMSCAKDDALTGGYFTIEDNGDDTHTVTIDCHDDAEPQNRVTAAKSCNKYLKNRKY